MVKNDVIKVLNFDKGHSQLLGLWRRKYVFSS